MHVETFQEYCSSKKGVEATFPFDEHTLVFKVMGKMFALLGLDGDPVSANLKCDPELALELREEWPEWILPGYHMNKQHWNTVYIEQFKDAQLREWIDHSYDLIVSSLPRKLKEELQAL